MPPKPRGKQISDDKFEQFQKETNAKFEQFQKDTDAKFDTLIKLVTQNQENPKDNSRNVEANEDEIDIRLKYKGHREKKMREFIEDKIEKNELINSLDIEYNEDTSREDLITLCIENKYTIYKKKDKDAPKGPRNSFIFYSDTHRNKVKAKLGDNAKPTDITKELSKMWKKVSSKEKDKYVQLQKDDIIRYNSEKVEYEKSNPKVNKSDKGIEIDISSNDEMSSSEDKSSSDESAKPVKKPVKNPSNKKRGRQIKKQTFKPVIDSDSEDVPIHYEPLNRNSIQNTVPEPEPEPELDLGPDLNESVEFFKKDSDSGSDFSASDSD